MDVGLFSTLNVVHGQKILHSDRLKPRAVMDENIYLVCFCRTLKNIYIYSCEYNKSDLKINPIFINKRKKMHCDSIPVITWVVWGFSSSYCLFLNLCLVVVDLSIPRSYLFSLLPIGKPSDNELARIIEVLDMYSMSVNNLVIL